MFDSIQIDSVLSEIYRPLGITFTRDLQGYNHMPFIEDHHGQTKNIPIFIKNIITGEEIQAPRVVGLLSSLLTRALLEVRLEAELDDNNSSIDKKYLGKKELTSKAIIKILGDHHAEHIPVI